MKSFLLIVMMGMLYSGNLLAVGAREAISKIKGYNSPQPPGFCENVKKCGITGQQGIPGPAGPEGLQGPAGECNGNCAQQNVYFVTSTFQGTCGAVEGTTGHYCLSDEVYPVYPVCAADDQQAGGIAVGGTIFDASSNPHQRCSLLNPEIYPNVQWTNQSTCTIKSVVTCFRTSIEK